MKQSHDVVARFRRRCKLDIFITIKCKPWWNAVKDNFCPGQHPSDWPDIITRITEDELKTNILWSISAYRYSIEFQKWELPHVNILIILNEGDKFLDPEEVKRNPMKKILYSSTESKLYRTN